MNSGKQGVYFQNLDGLRGIAALAVVFFHAANWFEYPHASFSRLLYQVLSFNSLGGELGVLFFFILSGFLITYLMFEETSKKGSISIGNFYMRRVLRIWPLYYLSVFVGFMLFPVLLSHHSLPASQNSNILMYLGFAANFDHILSGSPSNGMLGVQWSVAVEEQYYLLWPLFFYAFGKSRFFPAFIGISIFLSEYYFSQSSSGAVRYFHFFSNFRFLAFGAFLAWIAYFHTGKIEARFAKCSPLVLMLIYGTGLVLLFFHKPLSSISLYLSYILHFVPILFFGFVILEQNFSKNSSFKISKVPVLTWLGKISYGMYLIHMIGIYFVLALFPRGTDYYLLKILFSIILTIFISHLSYNFLESYFLKLKSRFSSTKTHLNKQTQ